MQLAGLLRAEVCPVAEPVGRPLGELALLPAKPPRQLLRQILTCRVPIYRQEDLQHEQQALIKGTLSM